MSRALCVVFDHGLGAELSCHLFVNFSPNLLCMVPWIVGWFQTGHVFHVGSLEAAYGVCVIKGWVVGLCLVFYGNRVMIEIQSAFGCGFISLRDVFT